MEKIKAEIARTILKEIETITDIQKTIEREKDNWWSFLTPNLQRLYNDGIEMPQTLRYEFEQAVSRSLEKLNDELEKL